MAKSLQIVLGVAILGALLAGFLVTYPLMVQGAANTTGQYTASSTSFALTTTSQNLLATSSRRVAASFQPVNCATSDIVHLNFAQGAVATAANSDYVVVASTTEVMSLFTGNPPPTESVTGITAMGVCSVKVTEWYNR